AAIGPCRLSATRDTVASGVTMPRISSTSPASTWPKNFSASSRALNGSRPPGASAAVLQRGLDVPGHADLPGLGLVLLLVGERGHPVAVEHPHPVGRRGGKERRRPVTQRGDGFARAVH